MALQKKILKVLSFGTMGVSSSAASGTVSGGNYPDSFVSGLIPKSAAGSIVTSKVQTQTNKLDKTNVIRRLTSFINQKQGGTDAYQAEQAKKPKTPPKVQISGAVGVLVDIDNVKATIGREDGSDALIKVGGQTQVISIISARPKMTSTAFSSNEGAYTPRDSITDSAGLPVLDASGNALSDEPPSSKAGAGVAINVAVMDMQSDALIETGVTLQAQGKVTVNASAENKIDPFGLWGANLVTPIIELSKTADFKASDGEQNVTAGAIVEDGERRWKANVNLGLIDLSTEDFENEPASWTEVVVTDAIKGILGSVAAYADDNFGLAGNLFDAWAQSFARGEQLSLAISTSVMVLDYTANAKIEDGVTIYVTSNGTATGISGADQDIEVGASAQNDMIALHGNFAPFGPTAGEGTTDVSRNKGFAQGLESFYKNHFESIADSKPVQNPLGEGETANGIGAAVTVLFEVTKANATIGDVTIKAHDMIVSSSTGHLNVGVAAAGGQASSLALNGSWNHTSIDSAAITQINSGADITLSGILDLDAVDATYIIQFAGAVSVSNSVAFGLSGLTILSDRRADVLIGGGPDATRLDTVANGGTGGGSVNVAGAMTMDAEIRGAVIGGAIAASVAKPNTDPGGATGGSGGSGGSSSPTTQSAGGLGGVSDATSGSGFSGASGAVGSGSTKSKGGYAISGSAIGFEEDLFITTDISGLSSLTSGSLAMRSEDKTVNVLLAGGVAITTTQSGVGVAGAVVVIVSDKSISSRVRTTDSHALGLTAGSISTSAFDRSTYFSLAVGVAVSTGAKGVGVAGSVTVTVANAKIDAGLVGTATNKITLASAVDLDIKAENRSTWVHISGAGAYGGAAGVGVAIGVAVVDSLVGTHLDHVVMANTVTAADLLVSAINNLTLVNLSFGVAVSTGSSAKGAGVGMVAINVYRGSTWVNATGSNVAVGGTGGLILSAFDSTALAATAGGFAGTSGKAAVGIALALNIARQGKDDSNVERGTEIKVRDSVLTSGAGLLSMTAASDLTMVAIAVGAAVAKSFALAGSAAVNRNDIGTKVDVGGTASLGGAGNMLVQAVDATDYVAVAGGVGIAFGGTSGAGGAGIAVNIANTPVTAKVDAAVALSDGDASVIARNEQVFVTVAMGGAGSGGFAIGGSVAVTDVKGAVTAEITSASAKAWTVGNLTVSGQESSTVVSVAGALAIGLSYGGVGAAFGFIFNERSVTGRISGPVTINASGHVQVTAGSRRPAGGTEDNTFLTNAIGGLGDDAFDQSDVSKTDLTSQMVNITAAIGGSKMVGIGFNLAFTKLDRDITAEVANGVVLNLSNDTTDVVDGGAAGQTAGLTVSANDASGIVVVAVGAAAAIGPGQAIAIAVAGSVAYSEIDSVVLAEVRGSTVNLQNEADLAILSRNDPDIIAVAIGAAVAVGGTIGSGAVGFSAAVNRIGTEVGASLSDSTVLATGGSKLNNVFVEVDNEALIVSVSLAAAISVSTGLVSFAGGGAGSGNLIKGATYAVVSDATVTDADAMSVDARATATITSVVVGIAVSVTAGQGTGLSFALGIAAADNAMGGLGRAITGLDGQPDYVVAARVVGSALTLDGALAVNARSDQTITAVVLAASVAVAASGGFSLSGAGAGAGAGNRGQAQVLAEIVGLDAADRTEAGAITVSALNLSQITAVIGSAAVAIAATGGSAVAVSIAVGISINSIDTTTTARITGFSATNGLVASNGAINVRASTAVTENGSEKKLEIDAVSVAASVAIAASGATGIAVAGGGANAINQITGDTTAEITDIADGHAASVSVVALNKTDITANVVVIAAGVGASTGGGAGAAAIGGVFISNTVGTRDDQNAVSALVRDARLDVSGAMLVSATNDSRIFANGDAVSAAVAASGDVAGALSGAGAGVYNNVSVRTSAAVERTVAGSADMLSVGSLSVTATDTATVEAVAVGAAVAVAVGALGFGLAISIGVAIAQNEVFNTVEARAEDLVTSTGRLVVAGKAEIAGTPPSNGVPAVGGNILISSSSTTTVTGTAVAASVAASFGLFGGIALSGAGASVTNWVANTSDASVANARLLAYRSPNIIATNGTDTGAPPLGQEGDIDILADNTTTLSARIVAAAVAASAGLVAGAGSIGVAILSSKVGSTPDDTTGPEHATRATVTGSNLSAGGDIGIEADSIETHKVEAASASVAIAIGIGGAVAGAGIGVAVDNFSNTEAISSNSVLRAGRDISILSFAETLVNDDVVDGSGSTMVGVALSVSAAAISINVNILRVDVQNRSHAHFLSDATIGVVADAGRDLTVDADSIVRLTGLNGVGVAMAGGGFAATGGGLEITLEVKNDVDATIDLGGRNALVRAANGTAKIEAKETAEFSSNVANINTAIAPIGLALGAAVMTTRHASNIKAQVKDAGVAGLAVVVNAEADVDINEVGATGVSVGTVAISINVSRAEALAAVSAVVDNATIVGARSVDITAFADFRVRADTTGVSAGLGAVGSMTAFGVTGNQHRTATSNPDDRVVEAEALVVVTGNSVLRGGLIGVNAGLRNDLFVETTVGGGGGLVGVGAVTNLTDYTTAKVRVGANTLIEGIGVVVSSRTDRAVDGKADAFAFGVASGSGATLLLKAYGDALVDFTPGTATDNSDRTKIVGQFIQIDTLNKVYKESIVGQNGENLGNVATVASGSGNLAGLTIIGTDADIGTADDKSRSAISLGNAWIRGEGSYSNAPSIAIRALTDHSVADAVEVTAVSGLAGLAVATTFQHINAETIVSMDGAHIDNIAGRVNVETRANLRNTTDAAIFQTGALSANMGIDVEAITNSATTITVADSLIEGGRVELSSGKANGTVNSLVSRTAANGSLASLFISLGVAVQENSTSRVSSVNIDANSTIRSAGNVFISAERGILQESDDGLVLVLAIPPYGYSVSNQGSHGGSATVDITAGALIRAGVNYQTYYEVAYIGGGSTNKWRESLPEAGTEARALTSAEKAIINVDASQNYEIRIWDSEALGVDLNNGDIVVLDAANGATANGTVGNYYEFIAADGTSLPIHAADFTDIALWRDLGASVSDLTQEVAVNSNATAFMRAAFNGQIAVIKALNAEMPGVSVGQLATLLAAQYQQVREWMVAHNTNEEALIRYQAQLEQIEAQMESLGIPVPGTTPDGPLLDETLETIFLTIPNLQAAPGSIYIESEQTPALFSPLVIDPDPSSSDIDPTLKAFRDVSIQVVSDVFAMHRINDVVIDNTKVARISQATGDYQEFYPGNIYFNDAVVPGSTSNQTDGTARINIFLQTQNRNDYEYIADIAAQYALLNTDPETGVAAELPRLPPDLYILGSIVNELGNVTISTDLGAIRLSGQLIAQTVNISAGGDFIVSTDWYHAAADPRTYAGISAFRSAITPTGALETRTAWSAWADESGGVNEAFADAVKAGRDFASNNSAVISRGIISIVATNVNVNGLIQSGVQAVSLTVPETFVPPRLSTSLVSPDNEGLFGLEFGEINNTQVAFRTRWDASEQAIIVDEMDFQGGRVEITGNVYSTGNGQLRVAAGYADVTIRNNSNYRMIINEIDASRFREGVIQITDTLNKPDNVAAKRTTYTYTSTGMDVETFNGSITRDANGDFQGVVFTQIGATQSLTSRTTNYTLTPDLFYIWTEGQQTIVQTIETYYAKSFNFIFDFDTGSGTLIDRNIEFLDDRPLLESEGVQSLAEILAYSGYVLDPAASALVPSMADANGLPTSQADLIGLFKRVPSAATKLQLTNVVRHDYTVTDSSGASTSKTDYWQFEGDLANGVSDLSIILSELFNADGTLKAEYETLFTPYSGGGFTETNRDSGQYLSTFENFDETERTWTEGGGYLKKKTFYRETTTTEGIKFYWDLGIRADHAISVGFVGGQTTPTIRIESVGDLTLVGDLKTAPTAQVFINPQFATPSRVMGPNGGDIISGRNISITGLLQPIHTTGTVDLTLVNLVTDTGASGGATDPLSAAQLPKSSAQTISIISERGDITLRLGSTTNADGGVILEKIWARDGDAHVIAPQGVFAASRGDTTPHVIGDRIELQASMGVVGGVDRALLIDSDALVVNGGFAASAAYGVNVIETAGDLALVQPDLIRTDFIRENEIGVSVGSIAGIVRLATLSGSILDFNFETDGALTEARLAAYQARLGLAEGNRTIAGLQLDNTVRSDYGAYVDYWNLVRLPLGDGPTASDDIETLSSFETLVQNTVQASIDRNALDASIPVLTEAEARALQLDRFEDLHAVEFDKSYRNTTVYQQYLAVFRGVALGATTMTVADADLETLASFAAEVDRQLLSRFAGDLTQLYGMLHSQLAAQDVGAGTDLRTYIETIHTDAAAKADLAGMASFQAYLTDTYGATPTEQETSDALAKFQPIHDALWSFKTDQLVSYIDVIRDGFEAEGVKVGDAYLSVYEQFLQRGAIATDVGAGTYDTLFSTVAAGERFEGAAIKTQIEADLLYRFGNIHEENRSKTAVSPTYVDSLFLEGAAREAAIDAELAHISSLASALPAAVAKRLFPLLPGISVIGGASAAAENANIIAPEVILAAQGSPASGEGQIGTLTAPVDIDFTAPVDIVEGLGSAERQARLDAQALRRALQVQDVIDVVYQLYVRTGSDVALSSAPANGALAADSGWTALTMVFADMTDGNRPPVTVVDGEVLVLWNTWPGQGPDATSLTYKLFEYTGGGVTFDPQGSNWSVPPAGFTEITNTIRKMPEIGAITVSTGEVFADFWDVERVSARPFADVNLRAVAGGAATVLDLEASSYVGIGHDGDTLSVRRADAAGFLRIVTTGSMFDIASDGEAARAQGYISLIADGAIGTSASPFRIDAQGDGVLYIQSGADAFIRQTGGDLTVQRALVATNLLLDLQSNLRIGDIDANGTVTLVVGGNVTDFASDDATPSADITAGALVLDIAGGFGAVGQRIEVDISGGISGEVGGALFINDFDVFLLIDDLTVTGSADIVAQGGIQSDPGATLTANGITLLSVLANIGSISQAFDILLTGGVLNAAAVNQVWLGSTGAVAANRISSQEIVTLGFGGALTNARSDTAPVVVTDRARIEATSVGTDAKAFETEVQKLALRTTSGDAVIHEVDDLRIDEAYFAGDKSFDVARNLTLNAAGTITVENVMSVVGSASIDANQDLIFSGNLADLDAASATLVSADLTRFSAGSSVSVAGTLDILLDELNSPDPDSEGGKLEMYGIWDAALINVLGNDDADTLDVAPERIDGDVVVSLRGGADLFTLTELNDRDPADSFTVDGGAVADEFIVNRAAAPVSYVVTFRDSGAADDGADFLTINGRDASGDVVMVRKYFVALLNEDADGATLPAFERIEYDETINGRVRVNALGGDDKFYSDDTSTMITLDGGKGEDFFQIGQVFGSNRVSTNGAVAAGDEIETNETTLGFLSVGNSHPMVVFGGEDNDTFNVYSNKGLTKLFGEDGNDTFVVRAFILKADPSQQAGGGLTQALGGGGEDTFLYNINAPVEIDGGAGVDKVVVIGTEIADSFFITEQGIYGAGLNVSFEGVEAAEVDGLQGDDIFYVKSTAANMVTTIIGGLGSDQIIVAGDVTSPIVSLEVEGTSAVVNHAVASADPTFNEIFVDGLRLNVATSENGLFEIDDSGLSTLAEGGLAGFYRVRVTDPSLAATAFLTVSATRSSSQDRDLVGAAKAQSVLVSTSETDDYASATVLDFAPGDTGWKTVWVRAPEDDAAEGLRAVVINHAATGAGPAIAAAKIRNVEATVFDNDAFGLLVAGNPAVVEVVEGGATATLRLTLSRAPAAGETVTVTPIFAGGDLDMSVPSVSFTLADWDTPKNILITAVDDSLVENRERLTVTLAISSDQPTGSYASVGEVDVDVRIFDNDRGEVLVTETNGDTIVTPTQNDSYLLSLSKAPTAPVVVSVLTDGQTTASSLDPRFDAASGTVTFTDADWYTPAEIVLSIGALAPQLQPTIQPGAQNHLLSGVRGPLYVYGGVGPGADRGLTVAQILPTETDTDRPDVTAPVNEDEQTDRIIMFNDGSSAIQSGRMTETNLSGFDMGALDLTLDFGTGGTIEERVFSAGISFFELEVVELLLGSNTDTLEIDGTAEDALTVIHGGGGADTISLTGTGEAGGADRMLAIFGDTTQDGQRYNSRTDALDGSGRQFAAGGADAIDASQATGFVLLYGGVGNDSITGSAFDDHLLGGSGDDTLNAGAGNDHVYGDNGLNIDLSVRMSLQTQLISVVSSQGIPAAGFNAQTGDALSAAGSDVITGSGSNVILADFGVIEQIAGTNRAYNTAALAAVRALREDQGSDDRVTLTGTGNDVVIGGIGADAIVAAGGTNILFGDVGFVTFDPTQAPLVAQTSTTVPELGGDDTVSAIGGNGWALGGAGSDEITFGDLGGAVLGDNGRIEASAARAFIRIETTDTAIGAADIIAAGNGAITILGGFGADSITAGNGDHVIFGDNGVVTFAASGRPMTLETSDTVAGTGGDDTISTGDGFDFVLAGVGADIVGFSTGGGVILGDNGRVGFRADGTRERVETTDPTLGGADSITGGNGAAIVMGGIGDDTVALGDGDHIALGDLGFATFSATGQPIEVASSADDPDEGGNDQITLGAGRDIVLGGAGADRVMIGTGGGALMGDNGRVLSNGEGAFVRIETRDPMHGDVDTLIAGAGASFVFGGTAADSIVTDAGDDVIAGDMGALVFLDGVRSVLEAGIEDPAYGGNDSVTSGAGDDWVILGEGDDQAASSAGLNVVIGDAGRIEAEGTTGIYARVESTQPGIGGNDTIIGGVDRDVQIGGAGADFLDGAAGNDLMQGDNGLLTRVGDFATGERTFESTFILEGDDDTLIGGDGRDVMIGGVGSDLFSLFVGDDAVAGEFLRIRFVPQSAERDLVTSFLTPAVRDLDLLVQITMGVNNHWGRSEVEILSEAELPVEADAFSGLGDLDFRALVGDRFDLLFLDDALYGAALIEGLFAITDEIGELPGLAGFRISSGELLILETAPAAMPDDSGGEGETSPAPTGEGEAPDDQAALEDVLREMARALATKDATDGGWQIKGWRLGSH